MGTLRNLFASVRRVIRLMCTGMSFEEAVDQDLRDRGFGIHIERTREETHDGTR